MPSTVHAGFEYLHRCLTPTDKESQALMSHRKSIKACLENNFDMTKFLRMGSTGNGTGVSKYSDTDYFAVIPDTYLRTDSSKSLRDIKEALIFRFPKTLVYVDSPAVVCPFGKLPIQTTEIVPAKYIESKNGFDIFEIPDRKGGWMKASPLAHNSYVTNMNNKLNKKVKPFIRFLKAWKYYCNVPISSFYLEIRIAKYCENKTSINYPIDIDKLFEFLLKNDLPKVIDPTGVSGYIHACKSESSKEEVTKKMAMAYSRIQKARLFEDKGKIDVAFAWWDKFFNGNFPSYS